MTRFSPRNSTVVLPVPNGDGIHRFLRTVGYPERIGMIGGVSFIMALTVPILFALDAGYPALVVSITSAAGMVYGWYTSRQKAKSVEKLRVDREARLAILSEAELAAVKLRHSDLERAFSEFKETAKKDHAEMRHEVEAHRDKVANLEANGRELRRRLATHVALITEISMILKTDKVESPRIDILISEWHRDNRSTWAPGDTP